MMSLVYGKGRTNVTTWNDRIDPLYELDYHDFLNTQWQRESKMTNEMRVTEEGVVRPTVAHREIIMQRPVNLTHSKRAIMIVAALSEFNHLTTAQLSTLTGLKMGYVQSTLEELSIIGVVLHLKLHRSYERNKAIAGVWRLDRRTVNRHLTAWAGQLTPLEWFLISNGVDMDTISGSNHPFAIQHNLMTNEIAIRAMETNPAIIGAWGERHSRMKDMYQQAKFNEAVARSNIGDGVLVTRSGKVIVIESSGSTLANKNSQNINALVNKAAAWVAACAYSELDIRVVFVDISARPDIDRLKMYVGVGVEKESSRYVTRTKYRKRGAEKIYIADGRRWFPSARGISEEFVWLRSYPALSNRMVNVIEEEDLITQDKDFVRNTLSALHTPSWIKNLPEMKLS